MGEIVRVLFLSDLWKPFPGGAENYVFNIARELQVRGHEISILTSYEKAEAGDPNFKLVQELGLGRRENREQRAEMLHEHVSNLSPDIIFIHRYFAEEYGSLVQQWGIPVVEVVHQHRKLSGAKFYIYNTEYTRRANGAEGDSNSMVIIPPPSQDAFIFHLAGRGDNIGFVKPLPGKGIEFLYEIADKMPDRKFLVLRGEWQTCETIREKPNVCFIDPVGKMQEFYEQCRIMLMPSLSEDAGTIPQEAAVNGIPCISSNVMGLTETNHGGILLPLESGRWVYEIDSLDNGIYYRAVADRQSNHIACFKWVKRFDELDRRLRNV